MNAIQTLPDTLASIRAIKGPNVEYVVIDGGSTDGTLALLAQNSDLIDVLVSEEDGGIPEALNRGLELSHGTYIGSLNADDNYQAEGMQSFIALAQQGGLSGDIVFGDCWLFDPVSGDQFLRHAGLEDIKRYMTLYHPSMFVRRDLYDRLGGYDVAYRLAMDCEFVHRAIVADASFQKVPLVLSQMALYGVSHRRLYSALAEFRRSVVRHGLQTPFLASYYFWRQLGVQQLLRWRPIRQVWLGLRRLF